MNQSQAARKPGARRKTGRVWATGGLLFVSASLLLAGGQTRFDRVFDTTANPRISITNLMGGVTIKGWDKPQVHAVCSTSSSRVEVDAETMPPNVPAEKIHFTTHVLDPLVSGKDETADYVLEVPLNSSLEIRNRQGSIRIEKLLGEAWVESVGATIFVADVAGHLAVRSVGGDIEIVRPSGRVEASSITGSLHFLFPTAPKLRGSTTSGRIVYEGDFVAGGDYTLSAYSGDMDILCPPSASFELNAKTVRGKLSNSLLLDPKRHSPSPLSSGNSLLGTHNTGNATVELTSFSGNIRIRPQP